MVPLSLSIAPETLSLRDGLRLWWWPVVTPAWRPPVVVVFLVVVVVVVVAAPLRRPRSLLMMPGLRAVVLVLRVAGMMIRAVKVVAEAYRSVLSLMEGPVGIPFRADVKRCCD